MLNVLRSVPVQPRPHGCRAVAGEHLLRDPLRFNGVHRANGFLGGGNGRGCDGQRIHAHPEQQCNGPLIGREFAAHRYRRLAGGPRQVARISCSSPGSNVSPIDATASLLRSAASAYCVRSLVPMDKKSTWRANAAALSAAAGTSTIMPTCNPAGRPRPARPIAVSKSSRAANNSSSVAIIGNITLTGVCCASRTIANS